MSTVPTKEDCEAEEGEARTPVLGWEMLLRCGLVQTHSLSPLHLSYVWPLQTESQSLLLFSSPKSRASDSLPKGKNIKEKNSTVLFCPHSTERQHFVL